MRDFRADLHIHTLLSPCGSLEMSPAAIVQLAKARNIDIIGITDHNHSGHSALIQELAAAEGIFVLRGFEVTSKEEAHCLAFFEKEHEIKAFQDFIDDHILKIDNNPDKFGYQVIIDKDEMITEEIPWLLINAIDYDVDKLARKVHSLNGLFIPAHVNREAFSLMSQLGFVPPDIKADALEISRHTTKEKFLKSQSYLSGFSFIQSSDAHYPEDLGRVWSIFHMEEASFAEIRKALKKEDGRNVKTLA